MVKHLISLFSLTVFLFVSICHAKFEGVKPASTCWDPKWKQNISLSDFIPSSVSTGLSGGGNTYEGANGASGPVGNTVLRSKLSFIKDSAELAQAFTCITGLLDSITGRNAETYLITVTNESGYILQFYGTQGLIYLNPNDKADYKVNNRYGAFLFKWNGRCYATRFEKGSSVIVSDKIYITNEKILVYQSNNRRYDAGCPWYAISDSFCNGPYNDEKELAFVNEYVENGYTKRCKSTGVFGGLS